MANTTALQLTVHPQPAEPKTASFWGGDDDGPSFKDMLDTINPLQHIPIISNIYQSLTGDSKPSTGSQIAGGTLFGGALGLLGSIINSIVEGETGTDIGGNIMSALTGTPTAKTAVAVPEQTAAALPADTYLNASHRSAYNAYVSVQKALG